MKTTPVKQVVCGEGIYKPNLLVPLPNIQWFGWYSVAWVSISEMNKTQGKWSFKNKLYSILGISKETFTRCSCGVVYITQGHIKCQCQM